MILHDSSSRRQTAASDPVAEHLAALRLDRIQQLAREIELRSEREPDELERITMRLLLDEYASALAHLRAIAREGARNVEQAPAPLKDVRRYVDREREIEAKQRASAAPSD